MLTPKKRKFALEYLKDLNGAQAAIRAGYSKNGAAVTATNLLIDPNVKEIIEQEQAKHAEKSGITIERVLKEYAKIGFSDITDYLDYDNSGVRLKASKDLADGKTAAISEVRADVESGEVRIKLHDKKNALDSIARHLGMFKDSVELKSDALVSLLQKIDGSTTSVK